MAATSVTGVGLGSADGKNKGSEHMTLGVGKLIGPRVVAADATTLAAGAASVVLPKLDGVVGDYIVTVQDSDGANAASGSLAFNTNDTTLTLAGTSTNVVHWAIVKKGLTV